MIGDQVPRSPRATRPGPACEEYQDWLRILDLAGREEVREDSSFQDPVVLEVIKLPRSHCCASVSSAIRFTMRTESAETAPRSYACTPTAWSRSASISRAFASWSASLTVDVATRSDSNIDADSRIASYATTSFVRHADLLVTLASRANRSVAGREGRGGDSSMSGYRTPARSASSCSKSTSSASVPDMRAAATSFCPASMSMTSTFRNLRSTARVRTPASLTVFCAVSS